MKAMILAAGRGERMRPLSDDTPKPLLKANGKRLIEYHLEALVRGGFHEIIINIAYLGDKIKTALGNGERYGLDIQYSNEGDQALETGGGIRHALSLLGRAPFLVINGDIASDYSFRPKSLATNDLAHLVLVDNPEHNPSGDFGIEKGRLLTNCDKKLTFGGIGYYRGELFTSCQEVKFPLAPLLFAAANENRISAEYYPGFWTDVGTPQRLDELDKVLRNGNSITLTF